MIIYFNQMYNVSFTTKITALDFAFSPPNFFLKRIFLFGDDVIIYLCSFIDCRLLWEFIYQLLQNPCYKEYVCWEKLDDYVFRINNPTGLAQLWGHQKNRTNMTYEKLSRALRYYYRMNIIKKVSGKRLTYK